MPPTSLTTFMIFHIEESESFKTPRIDKLPFYKIPMINMIPLDDLHFTSIELGRGSFGIVTKGSYLKTPVAIKSIDLIGEYKAIMREISILSQITHENIIGIMAGCRRKLQFHIVMPYFESISLNRALFDDRYKKNYVFDIESNNDITLQICRAIYYFHSNPRKVIHRDIKPANILINKNYKVKVCDLGLSQINVMVTELKTTNRCIKATTPLSRNCTAKI